MLPSSSSPVAAERGAVAAVVVAAAELAEEAKSASDGKVQEGSRKGLEEGTLGAAAAVRKGPGVPRGAGSLAWRVDLFATRLSEPLRWVNLIPSL